MQTAVSMGTGLRDVVKGLMGVLDLTVPAQGDGAVKDLRWR